MLQLTTKLMNMFSYFITTHFIPGNKDYHSCCNLYSVYQTYPKCISVCVDCGWMDLTFSKIMAYFRNMPRIFYGLQYFYNIFTTNHKLLVVISSNLNLILRVRLVHWMWITTGMVIFITRNKMCCNGITKPIH